MYTELYLLLARQWRSHWRAFRRLRRMRASRRLSMVRQYRYLFTISNRRARGLVPSK